MTLTKRDLVIQITEDINRQYKKLDKKLQRKQVEQQKSGKLKPGRKKQERSALEQRQVFEVVQKTLDGITHALASGQKVELRKFGVFEVKVRKARVGRNPNEPSTDVPIPARSVVKFKAGKEMRVRVLKLPAKPAPATLKSARQA
jgi:nucleoid DNA-binding protein